MISKVVMIIRKLFDPNYATKKVDAISRDTKRQIEDIKKTTDEYKRISKLDDVAMIVFTVAGGKRNGS